MVKNTTSADDVMEEFNEVFENISDEKLDKMLDKQITIVPSARKLVSNCETTVKPLNSGHHWFLEKVSAIERCLL